MLRLKRAVDRDTKVVGLLLGQLGELDADLVQMQTRDFFVEFFRQHVNTNLVGVAIFPEVELRQDLVGKGVGHDEARVTRGTAKVY